jgi:hypothetical protein
MWRMPDAELVTRVAVTTGLRPSEAARVIDDVVSYYAEPAEDFVRRRHEELQTYGLRNAAIFEQISTELEGRVVAAPELSLRQLRRIVYG